MKTEDGRRIIFAKVFCGQDLAGADFSNCIIGRCLFNDANLEGANFSGAWIEHTVFSGANLHSARFERAAIRKSIFLDAKNVSSIYCDCAVMDVETAQQFDGALTAEEANDD